MRLRTLTAYCALGASIALGAETEPSPKPTGMQDSVKVVLVQLPILASGRQGIPVTDLSADEMVVTVDGSKVPVRYLELMHRRSTQPEDMSRVRLYVEAPGGWQLPHVSTSGPPNYVVFLLDVQNDNRLQRDKAIDAVVEFATTKLDLSTSAAVLAFDGSLHVELPFTTDRNALASVLRQAWARTGRAKLDLQSEMRDLLHRLDECAQSGDTLSRSGDERCLREAATDYIAQIRPRSEEFLGALKDAVQFLGGLRGRKTMYALSHGVLIDPGRIVAEAIRSVLGDTAQVATFRLDSGPENSLVIAKSQLLELAVRNKVSLNFLDRMRPPTQDSGASSGRLKYPGTFPTEALYDLAQDDLAEIASTTGGLFVASTEVLEGLNHILEVQDGAYELGYQLDRAPTKEDAAKTKVSTTRKGVRLTYRRGYRFGDAVRADELHGRILILQSAARDMKDAVALPRDFVIEADPRQIGYKKVGAEFAATFTLDVVVEDDQGRERVGSYHLINHAYPVGLWKAGDVAPVTIRGWVELPPGRFILKAIFRNTETGWEGEIDRSVTVEPAPAG